ncbi:MAG: class I SAM-dependent methyltransferase [Ruminococcus sp.]|nr:class I SAM-dependent methyltransferase [Ruminococcus sp.]
MKLFSLDERLLTCAGLVQKSARLADIGSDHAYLPVWLLKSGRIESAIASDIGEKPLQSGRLTAEKYGARNIEFRLGSGLSTISSDDNITDIVIAGMGGEVIADILSHSELVKNPGLNLILQPMTRSDDLIGFLYENGFDIKEQKALSSKGRYYTVMLVRYSGKRLSVSSVFKIVGKLDLTEEESVKYINKHIRNLENKSRGDESAKRLLNELRSMINEKN